MLFAVDRVIRNASLLPKASRVGLVTNDAARLASDAGRLGRVALIATGVPIVRLFSPEHGLSATGADGAPSPDGTDPVTGLPVVSLYGDHLAPPAESLSDLDLVLFDIPDVGARFYTYLWTLSHLMESCATAGIPLAILDRPNPLGGDLGSAEGPMLDEARCSSFVGRWSIPVRHSLTLGELARYWHRTRLPTLQLHVVPCAHWRRADRWPTWQHVWIETSPAMRAFESALLYPGMCLFEGTSLSVGRGTVAPFQCIAAPWLQPELVAAEVSVREVRLSTGVVVPAHAPYAGEKCGSLHVEVMDEPRLRPVRVALSLLSAVIRTHRAHFAWAPYPTAANPTGANHFALLSGHPELASELEALEGAPTSADLARWTDTGTWSADVRESLLYD